MIETLSSSHCLLHTEPTIMPAIERKEAKEIVLFAACQICRLNTIVRLYSHKETVITLNNVNE